MHYDMGKIMVIEAQVHEYKIVVNSLNLILKFRIVMNQGRIHKENG